MNDSIERIKGEFEKKFDEKYLMKNFALYDKERDIPATTNNVKLFLRASLLSIREEAIEELDRCKDCGSKDVVCAKGVQEQITTAVVRERKATIEDAVACVPEEDRAKWGSENQDIYVAYENGFNTCRTQTLSALASLAEKEEVISNYVGV